MIRTKGRSDLDLLKKRHRKERGPWTLWVNRTKKKELTLDSLPLPKLLENYDKGAQIQVAKSPLTNRLEDHRWSFTHSRHVHCIEIYQLRTIDITRIQSLPKRRSFDRMKSMLGSCRFDEKERHSRSFTCALVVSNRTESQKENEWGALISFPAAWLIMRKRILPLPIGLVQHLHRTPYQLAQGNWFR